jgi:SAM-dependent methyltransferase
MSNSFDVNEYWLKRGQTYIGEQRRPVAYHQLQEKFLFDVLREGRLPMGKVLEVGCGFGRVTRLLAENFPAAQITALDLSPDQLANAAQYCAGRGNIVFQQYDFYSGQPFPGGDYDCAIAIEVFLHHPASVIRGLIERLLAVSPCIVNIDWSEEWPWQTPPHVWVHNYEALYREAGLQCAAFPLPEKVDGKQQKLFVAARKLSAELTDLERQLQKEPSTPAPPAADRWLHQLEVARQEIARLIPPGSSFILVDDAQWGGAPLPDGRRAIPFLERDGQYWGPPADDAMAIRELERVRQAGASQIVFAWPCFWWLEHYAGLCQHLRRSYPCILENERLIVFQLTATAR